MRPRRSRPRLLAGLVAAMMSACAAADAERVTAPETVAVPAGVYLRGSSTEERELAYQLDERAYGHSRTRAGGWYDREPALGEATTDAYQITRNLVTNADYARFVAVTGHPAPEVDAATWQGYGLIHPYERTRRHAWTGGRPPDGRDNHPVVLVSHADAAAYAAWLSDATGLSWRLPSEAEWEKAARGADGRHFPWGDQWDPAQLNSHDQGPFDTVAVGTFPNGASPFGLLDPAGQVFEWTATTAGGGAGARFVVKGGSWDDRGCGVCRPAAGHTRPADLKHILIGFRLVHDPD